MRLTNICATPHPSGNRIDLQWTNPDPSQYPGVRVVRREHTHPTTPEDGVVVIQGEGLDKVEDKNLKGETVYYYSLFPYKKNTGEFQFDIFDPHNRVCALSTAPYNCAGQMWELLPGIYHRYDRVLPQQTGDAMAKEDKEKGQLRRFLDIPGSKLDGLYSFAKAMLDFYNLDRVDGRFLSLLAQWIGWQTDYTLEYAAQRNEIKNAPYVYKTIGITPTVEALVKRLTGEECRSKEFVHNIFRSNVPEQLNMWVGKREGTAGSWIESEEPLSLDWAYEGRPSTVRDADGVRWLFYHTFKKGRWDIWYKTFREDEGWSVNQPLTHRKEIDKHPSALLRGETIWVFWNSYNERKRCWCICYRTLVNGQWSAITTLPDWIILHSWHKEYQDHRTVDCATTPIITKFRTCGNQQRKPWAIVDHLDRIWLFWLENEGDRWHLKYNRFNGTVWEFDPAKDFPEDSEGWAPGAQSDPFVLFHPNQSIWVFWDQSLESRGHTTWHIAYRFLQVSEENSTWSDLSFLPQEPHEEDHDRNPAEYCHDREPAGFINNEGNIELFWSSNRDGNWSIWHNTLSIDSQNMLDQRWGEGRKITDDAYSHRNPLPWVLDGTIWLIYRSNKSLFYKSIEYGATETVDFRYAGCTTVDVQNKPKIDLQGHYDDFGTYIYDTGKDGKQDDPHWYSRNTVGIYLPSISNKKMIDDVVKPFLPLQVRLVFITPEETE